MVRRFVALSLAVIAITVGIAANHGSSHAPTLASSPERAATTEADVLECRRLERQGDFRRAAEAATAQVASARERFGPRDPRVAHPLNRLGEAYHGQGCYAEAAAAHEEALELLYDDANSSPVAIAETMCSLARAEKNIGLLKEAAARYATALGLARRALGEEHPVVARCLNGLANVTRRSDPDSATALFERALAIRAAALGPEHPDVAETRTDLAYHLAREGETSRAMQLVKQAIPSIRSQTGPHHPDLALALSVLGSTLLVAGEYESAERTFREVTSIYEVARQRSFCGPNRTVKYKLPTYGDLAASLLLQERFDEAWPFLERSLSPGLTEQIAGPRAEEARPFDGGIPTCVSTLEEVQKHLSASTAIIGWLDIAVEKDEALAAWGFVIRSAGRVRWERLKLAPPGLARPTAFERFRSRILESSEWPAPLLDCDEIDALARGAFEERFAPLVPHLGGVDHLVVLSSTSWGDVPIEALVDRSARPLLETYTISYAPSATVFAWLTEHSRARAGAGRCLLVGDPRVRGAIGTNETHEWPRDHSAAGDLAWARWEILEIAAGWSKPVILLGSDASEESLSRLAGDGTLGRFDTIHFASHSVRSSWLPEYIALVLAKSPGDAGEPSDHFYRAASPSDGLLLPGEIGQWRLGADLVTLSGCTTRGKHIHGEGFLGTAEAFLRAGASSVVASLWQVDDHAASLLMVRFYEELEQRNGSAKNAAHCKACALRRAKLWLREATDEARTRSHQHPVDWAPFVLVGGDPTRHGV